MTRQSKKKVKPLKVWIVVENDYEFGGPIFYYSTEFFSTLKAAKLERAYRMVPNSFKIIPVLITPIIKSSKK